MKLAWMEGTAGFWLTRILDSIGSQSGGGIQQLAGFVIVCLMFTLVGFCLSSKRALAANKSDEEMLTRLSKLHSLELSEILNILRAQRHEFINHLQVIYGMLQTGKGDGIPDYIQKASQMISLENKLLGLPPGEFRNALLAAMVAAQTAAIDFSVNMGGNQHWEGFADLELEKSLCFRLLLSNLVFELSCLDQSGKTLEVVLIPGQNENRVEIRVRPADAIILDDVVRLPDVFQEMLGIERQLTIDSLWSHGIGGSFALIRGEEGELQVVLSDGT